MISLTSKKDFSDHIMLRSRSFSCDRYCLVNRATLPEAIISYQEIVLANIFNLPTFSSTQLFFLSQLSRTEIVFNRITEYRYIKRIKTRRNFRSGKSNIVLLASAAMLAEKSKNIVVVKNIAEINQ